MLEYSHYLEEYLWPNYKAGKSGNMATLSIVLMVNEKFREGHAGFAAMVADRAEFPGFVNTVLSLLLDPKGLSAKEETALVTFLVRLFQSSVGIPAHWALTTRSRSLGPSLT